MTNLSFNIKLQSNLKKKMPDIEKETMFIPLLDFDVHRRNLM